MTRLSVASPARANRYTISCLGDSLTGSPGYGVAPEVHWPEQLATALRAAGCHVKARNFGRGGNTTGPYVTATTTVAGVTDTTHFALTSATGFANLSTIIVNGQVSTISALSGVNVTLATAITGLTIGQTVTQVSQANADLTSRLGVMTYYDIPDIAVVWGGVNDPTKLWNATLNPATGAYSTGAVQSGATQTSIPLATGKGAGFIVGQNVVLTSGTSVMVSQCVAISTDTLTVFPALPYAPTTAFTASQGTQANLQYLIQSLLNAGVKRVLVLNSQYLDYASGGDSITAGVLTPYTVYQQLRGYQYQAVQTFAGSTQGAVVWCDVFNAMASIINGSASFTSGGTVPSTFSTTGTNPFGATSTVSYLGVPYLIAQSVDTVPPVVANSFSGGFSWHVASGTNQHLNPLGQWIVSQIVGAALSAQSGWISAIT